MKDIYMKELSKLATGLMKRNIPFSFTAFMNGGKIDWGTCNAICHDGSYGRQDSLLEIMAILLMKSRLKFIPYSNLEIRMFWILLLRRLRFPTLMTLLIWPVKSSRISTALSR